MRRFVLGTTYTSHSTTHGTVMNGFNFVCLYPGDREE